jgi:hypothetical protein
MGHLGSKYAKMFESMGYSKEDAREEGMRLSKGIFSAAINHHNEGGHSPLPPINSAEWRRNHTGAHDKISQQHERQVRGGTPLEDGSRPLLNYSLNQGHVDIEGSDKGAWIDAGLHPMWESTNYVANAFNRSMLANKYNGMEVPEDKLPDIDSISYMNSIKVPLELLTFGKIQTMNRAGAQEHFVEGSGHLPGYKTQGSQQKGVVENFHPLDIPWIPKGLLAYNPTAARS